MNSLVESPVDVKETLDFLNEVLEEATFQEAVSAAAAHFEQAVQENKPMLSWTDLVNLYRQVFAAAHKLDLSRFEVPPMPELSPTEFLAAWVAEMEAEFGDMEDADIASRTGVPMF